MCRSPRCPFWSSHGLTDTVFTLRLRAVVDVHLSVVRRRQVFAGCEPEQSCAVVMTPIPGDGSTALVASTGISDADWSVTGRTEVPFVITSQWVASTATEAYRS